MTVLVTGAFGIVGKSTVEELVHQGHHVHIFDLPTRKNKHMAGSLPDNIAVCWGDVTHAPDLENVVTGMDVIIHLAAVIPPLADKKPLLAEKVNVTGTTNLIRAMEKTTPRPKLIFTSSISVYGDRLKNPYITLSDALRPNDDDHYAHHKIECEKLIRGSSLEWVIFRLSYVVSTRKLQMDPIMFDIPLATSFEICDSTDVARALANAVSNPAVWGKTFHIAGGEQCRIGYRDYLKKMLSLFGVGNKAIPDTAFKRSGFHCGFMDTKMSQDLLHYQHMTLADYFREVEKKMRFKRFFIGIFSALAEKILFSRSPHRPAALRRVSLKTKEA
jgi:nucleoside-diphosphate-sugar epimerase